MGRVPPRPILVKINRILKNTELVYASSVAVIVRFHPRKQTAGEVQGPQDDDDYPERTLH
jgi:hypothetical protein